MFRFDRFEELVAETGVSKAHIGRKLGKDQFYIRDKIKNKSDFKPEQVIIIADALHTTPAYLTGESNEKTATPEGDGLTEAQRKLLELIPLLSDSDVSVISATAQSLIASRKSQDSV